MNEQDEALLLEYVEGGLTGPELERAKVLLARDSALAARVEAMRRDRDHLHALGAATAQMGAELNAKSGAGQPLPDAVQQAISQWEKKSVSGAGENTSATAGRIGPESSSTDESSHKHASSRRPWRVELLVVYGGIAAMLVVGAIAVLSPDEPHATAVRGPMPLMSARPDDAAKNEAFGLSDKVSGKDVSKENDSVAEIKPGGEDRNFARVAKQDGMLGGMRRNADTGEKLAEQKELTLKSLPVATAATPAPAPSVVSREATPRRDSDAKSADDRLSQPVGNDSGMTAAAPGAVPSDVDGLGGKAGRKGGRSEAAVMDEAPRNAENSPRLAAASERAAARNAAAERARNTTSLDAVITEGVATTEKRDPSGPAEVIVEAASLDQALRLVSDWAKLRRVPIESLTRADAKTPATARPAEAGAKANAALEPNTGQVTMQVTAAELSDLLLHLRGARGVNAAKLDSAPPAVQSFVAAAMSRPAMSFSVAELEDGAGAQNRHIDKKADEKKSEENSKAKTAAAEPAKSSTQPLGKGIEAPPIVRAIITVREKRK